MQPLSSFNTNKPITDDNGYFFLSSVSPNLNPWSTKYRKTPRPQMRLLNEMVTPRPCEIEKKTLFYDSWNNLVISRMSEVEVGLDFILLTFPGKNFL